MLSSGNDTIPNIEFVSLTDFDRSLTYQLGNSILNAIKANVGLCNSIKSCFLSATKSFVNDTRGNPLSIAFITIVSGLQASSFTPDTTPPTLISWSYDLALGQLSLVFSETVYTAFFNYSAIVFYATAVNTSSTGIQTLDLLRVFNSSSEITDWSVLPANTNIQVVQLSSIQKDYVLSQSVLLRSVNTSFLILEPNAVVDTSMNRFQGMSNDVAMQASEITYTRILPRCLAFGRTLHIVVYKIKICTISKNLFSYLGLDMTQQLISIEFSEVMDIGSVSFASNALLQSNADADATTEAFSFEADFLKLLTTQNNTLITLQFTVLFACIKCFVAFL